MPFHQWLTHAGRILHCWTASWQWQQHHTSGVYKFMSEQLRIWMCCWTMLQERKTWRYKIVSYSFCYSLVSCIVFPVLLWNSRCLLLGHFTPCPLTVPSCVITFRTLMCCTRVSLSQTAFTLCASFPVYEFVLVPCDCVPTFESVKLLIVSSLPLPASPPFLFLPLSDLTVCVCTNPFMFMMDWDSSGNWVFSLLISPSLCSAWTAWTAQRWTLQTLNQCALPLRHSHNRFTITKRSVFSVRNERSCSPAKRSSEES